MTNNKVAVVSGGVGEIGRAICERFARAHLRVAAVDLNATSDAALAWQARMRESGLEVALVEADVTDIASCADALERIRQAVGPVGILVNCAGITRDATFKKMDKGKWDAVLSVNLDSVFNVTKQVIDDMVGQGFGRVINISSLNGEKGQFGQTNYSAAKAGMHGFTMALAQEVARKGVTVNTVSPGYIATQMAMAVPEEVLQGIITQIPVGRLGKPDEIAAVVSFLASEEAGFLTGANISVNGGQHMH